MSKHTPGPWKIEEDKGHYVICDDANFSDIAVVYTKEHSQLFLAAPDLLEALQMVKGIFYLKGWENDPVGVAADAAIKKALGEGA
jgi:hypothetical protein